MRTMYVRIVGGVCCAVALVLLGACTPTGGPDGGNGGGDFVTPSAGDAFSAHFTGEQPSGMALSASEDAALPDGGSLALPQGSSAGIGVGIATGALTSSASDAFAEEFPDTTLESEVLQITVRPEAATPEYLILRLPATDESARIFLAGYMDEDTTELAWEPLSTRFDADAGEAVAMIGWEQLGPVVLAEAEAAKSLAPVQDGAPIVYTGHVAIGIGSQSFEGEVVFIAEEPTEALTVILGGPPIPARARIGLKLSNITHQPLSTLTVTSDFGPRDRPVQGASTNHRGVDYRAADGTTVFAAGDGTVITSRCANASVNCGRKANGDISAGYIVEIDHGNGEVTRYLHMTNPASVNVGDMVTGGQPIGLSDSTGGVAAHLHFEVKKNGIAVDPELTFNQQVTATIAMAVDEQIEFGTAQQFQITRGIITPEDMAEYVNIVELTDVEPGMHMLQFVLVEPRGQLAILAEVPLTVLPPGDIVGTEVSYSEIVWTPESGLVDYSYSKRTATFSLLLTDDQPFEGLNYEGTAHLTYETRGETTNFGTDCPTRTFASGLVEWDTPVIGFASTQPDGLVLLQVNAEQSQGPPFLIVHTNPGCLPTPPVMSSGDIWTGVNAFLEDGRYDNRDDFPLGTNETGEHYYELHIQQIENPSN